MADALGPAGGCVEFPSWRGMDQTLDRTISAHAHIAQMVKLSPRGALGENLAFTFFFPEPGVHSVKWDQQFLPVSVFSVNTDYALARHCAERYIFMRLLWGKQKMKVKACYKCESS